MRAVRIREPGGPDVLETTERPDPRPGSGEALVAVRAAGVNRADLLQRRGRYPAPEGAPSDVPGLEVAGEVVALGRRSSRADGERLREGDRVMGIVAGGGYATRVAVPTGQLMLVPPELGWEEAAAVPEAFLTAFDALFFRGRLEEGERVLLHSVGGGVGTAAVQIARRAGVARVFGTASAAKLEGLARIGLAPDVAVDYRSESFAATVAEETGGEGVDVILDTVGAPYWEDNLASLAELGRLVLVGTLGGAVVETNLGALMRRRATVVGTVLRARSVREKSELTAAFGERFLEDLAEGRLRPVVDRVFRLEEAPAAHRYMEENRNLGRIILRVGPEPPRPEASGGSARPGSP